ncbi:MAG: right-handed parallel beta-helix repeat-containing protein [Promethearchaeota archaeon]|nr:MAG: right-handed parallel beta-helix repeat-containing protein [Candidatus Lokiarchaeota archaeon]
MVFNKKILYASIVIVVVAAGFSILLYFGIFIPKENGQQPVFKGGTIAQDETWSGAIFVNEHIVVPTNVTLTILPGTQILCKANRDYKTTGPVGFTVNGGTIIAIGTPEKQIWFTVDEEYPINGDWGGIELYQTNTSVFKYVIVEYSVMGIAQFYSQVNISHSIVRWVNLEGIYMEHSNPLIEYNLLYQNGYHEISCEQYNYDVRVRNNIFAGGHVPFITLDSNITLEGNYFHNYNSTDAIAIHVGGLSNATIIGNKFDGFTYDTAFVKLVETAFIYNSSNDLGSGTVPVPILDFEDIKRQDLGYTPGDPEDQYMYVYPSEDETRRVLKRIGVGLGFGWTLAYANDFLWKMETGYLIQIDPILGNYTKYPVNASDVLGPRGLCYDGEFFWVQDQSQFTIVKMKFNGTNVVINDTFIIPESEKGGRSGLATDGIYLYIASMDGTLLYELYKNGTIRQNITIGAIDLVGAFTWNGTHFWSNQGNILIAWTREGVIVGKVYDVAAGNTGLTWDGTHIWGLYKTCEIWDDAKTFQIEILDDSFI